MVVDGRFIFNISKRINFYNDLPVTQLAESSVALVLLDPELASLRLEEAELNGGKERSDGEGDGGWGTVRRVLRRRGLYRGGSLNGTVKRNDDKIIFA